MRNFSFVEKIQLFVFLSALCGFFLLDRLLKIFFLDFSGRFTVFGDFLYFETLRNEHLAFGIPVRAGWIVWPSAVFFIVIIFFLIKTVRRGQVFFGGALLLVLFGALSNFYDRLVFSYVIDYIHVWWWPVFNLSDAMIVLGVAGFIFFERREKRQGKNILQS